MEIVLTSTSEKDTHPDSGANNHKKNFDKN